MPDQPYVLLGSVAHYFYEFSQLNRSYLVTLKLELEDNGDKRKETWWIDFSKNLERCVKANCST